MHNSPDLPPEETSKSLVTPLRVLWVLVLGLFLVNAYILSSSNEEGAEINDERDIVERMSWWESFRQSIDDEERIETVRSVIDGKELDPDTQEEMLWVMIDNFVTAQDQQYGVSKASLVYEAQAEGGITRLMLGFPYQELGRVGPVRSARDYFVETAAEYGGIYAHAGGAPTALELLAQEANLLDADEDDRESGNLYSFRDDRYFAPHNLFFDLLNLREYARLRRATPISPQDERCVSEEATELGLSVSSVDISFLFEPDSDYDVSFEYDSEAGVYLRSQANGPHMDLLDNQQVSPSAVIVRFVSSYLIPDDDKERISYDLIGSGDAYFFWNGGFSQGSWRKSAPNAATQYSLSDGSPVCFPSGQNWFAFVEDPALVSYELETSNNTSSSSLE